MCNNDRRQCEGKCKFHWYCADCNIYCLLQECTTSTSNSMMRTSPALPSECTFLRTAVWHEMSLSTHWKTGVFRYSLICTILYAQTAIMAMFVTFSVCLPNGLKWLYLQNFFETLYRYCQVQITVSWIWKRICRSNWIFWQVDKASTFTVSYNGAKGTLNACVRTPSGGHEDCFVQEMDEGLYGVRFIPKENGVHYLDIKLNDHHIPDSPFAIMVGSMAADPAMVLAHGDGLERGSTGMNCYFKYLS